jgi:thioredoxin reductase (NADPH)
VHRFGVESRYETVTRVDFSERPFKLWNERGDEFHTRAVIVATGASAKLLDVPGESEYMGFGVSACATCDGFFFRDQHVYVIGGGDTAMEEANFLTKFASKVTVVHRRKDFRASRIMLDRALNNHKIGFMLDTVVEEYVGVEENGRKRLTHLKVRNTEDGEEQLVEADGAFVAIGHQPNTQLFTGLLDMDDVGYIITQGKSSRTNIPGVFACGDAQDSLYRQAITAAGSGCMAAIDAERFLGH